MENKYSNKYLIETGISLQYVDGLKNSTYFLSQADRYVKGEISFGIIKANPRISIDELASRIDISPRTIDNVIALLSKENRIKRINGKRFGHWEIL